jgi:hypothetical protein
MAQASPTPAQTQSIGRQAYIYGYPMVDLYRISYQFFINDQSAERRHRANKLYNAPGLLTPDNATLQSPDADVLYSFALLDLRAQPSVVTLPAISRNRYYSAQFVDQYTFNIAYAGTRTTGNGGGRFLVIGPGWKNAAPPGIKQVIRADTQFVLVVLRTQVFNAADLGAARKVQDGYRVQSLSEYVHKPAPAAPSKVDWLLPLGRDAQMRGLDFFNLLAFVARFCTIAPDERSMWQRFATIGIKPGEHFDTSAMALDNVKALRTGMTVGQLDVLATRQKLTSSIGVFGDRAQLKGDYLKRAAGAQLGILGNTAQETLSYVIIQDPEKRPLSGLLNKYSLHLGPGALPPVNAFWSLTLYQLPSRLLVPNPLGRYFVDSGMLQSMTKDTDGGYTIMVQGAAPGGDLDSNWLPAPQAQFYLILRLYYPKAEALQGQWKPPAIRVLAPVTPSPVLPGPSGPTPNPAATASP